MLGNGRVERTLGHAPVIVVSVVGAELHAVVNGHRAVNSEQLQRSFHEAVAAVARVTVH